MSTLELKGGLIEAIAKINDAEVLSKLLRLALDSIHEEEEDFQLSEAWKVEIDQRDAALEDGSSVGRPLKEVLAKYKQ